MWSSSAVPFLLLLLLLLLDHAVLVVVLTLLVKGAVQDFALFVGQHHVAVYQRLLEVTIEGRATCACRTSDALSCSLGLGKAASQSGAGCANSCRLLAQWPHGKSSVKLNLDRVGIVVLTALMSGLLFTLRFAIDVCFAKEIYIIEGRREM